MIAALSPTTAWLAWIAVLIAGSLVAFLYNGLEIGIYVMNKVRLDLRAESGSRPARAVRRILRNQRNFLAVLLIGTNLTHYAITFAVSAMFILAGRQERAEWYTLLVVTPLLFIFCESVPKNVAQRTAERFVFRWQWVLQLSDVLFNACGLALLVRGFSWLLVRLTGSRSEGHLPMSHEGLSAVVAEGHAVGVLTHSQSVMAERVMRISEVLLRDVMIPMHRVARAPQGVDRGQMLQLMETHNFSRFPVCDADGQVTAILDIYDALVEHRDTPSLDALTEPLVLPAGRGVTEALYQMRQAQAHMAIVADRRDRHVGIVTIKDLVEEIVGELDAW